MSGRQAWRELADLHVHTCLSSCAEPEMTPEAIVTAARARGLSVVAICDHDTAGSCEAVMHAAPSDLCVVAGVEVTIEDGKHVLGWFRDASAAANAAQELCGAACRRPTLSRTVQVIHAHGGLAVAAHVDRPSSGILGRGGRLPREVPLDAMELSRSALSSQMRSTLEGIGVTLTTGSDAHALEEIGKCATVLEAPRGSFDELALAIRGEQGRRCRLA